MAGKFHATFVVRDPSTMELIFDDAPWNDATTLTDVEVKIFERDQSLGGKEEVSKDDWLGTVALDLRRVPGVADAGPALAITRARFDPRPADGRMHSGSFKLRVGAETFLVAVFMERDEWPHDRPPMWANTIERATELGLEVSLVGKPTYSSLDKKLRTDRLPRLLGPVVTYIASPLGSGDQLANNAQAHWRPRSDVLIRREGNMLSLDDILRDLAECSQGSVEWGQVNIVAHGNLAGLLLPLRAGEQARELTALDVNDLQTRNLRCLRRGFSHVVIRGCSIGRDSKLLRDA